MTVEMCETGLVFLQNYNTAYFKNISDTDYYTLCYSWWNYTAAFCNIIGGWSLGLEVPGEVTDAL